MTSGSTSYTRSFTPNTLLQPSVIQAYPTSSPTSPIFKLTYGYGSGTNNGSIASITDGASGHSGRDESFSYDTLNRIHTATVGSSTWGTQYGYDQFGNLTSGTLLSGYSAPTNWTANTTTPMKNQVSSSGYDADGRANTVNSSITYGYDAEGRILSSNSTSYVYDGDGYRVKKVGSSTTLYWPGPSGALIDESNSAGTSFGRQVWFGGLLVWNQDTSGNGRFLFQDHLGSTRVTANSSGSVLDDIDYALFGTQLANHGTASTNHYNFTGYETDVDSSNYATFRNMDSVHGRFDRPDPYLGSYDLGNPQSLNRYSYVLNNPLNWTDPIGLNLYYCERTVNTQHGDGTVYGPWQCTDLGGSSGFSGGGPGGGGVGGNASSPKKPQTKQACVAAAQDRFNSQVGNIRSSFAKNALRDAIIGAVVGGAAGCIAGAVTASTVFLPAAWTGIPEGGGCAALAPVGAWNGAFTGVVGTGVGAIWDAYSARKQMNNQIANVCSKLP